jgi:hypothetical protein
MSPVRPPYSEHVMSNEKNNEAASVAQGMTLPQMEMLRALLVSIRPEYGTPGSRDVDIGRQQKRIDAALAILAQAAPPAAQKCATCNDHGMIGGPSYYAPDEGGVPCPDCAAAAAGNTTPITANSAEITPGTLPYPTEPTDALLEVLGLMLYTTTPIAHALRAAGTDIPKRCEEEQAHVLHWLIQLALQHGTEWRARAWRSIDELQAATQSSGEVSA